LPRPGAAGIREIAVKIKNIRAIVIVIVLLGACGSMALAAQDKFTVKAPSGLEPDISSEVTAKVLAVGDADNGRQHGHLAVSQHRPSTLCQAKRP
jgi:hypothetical protein